MICKDNNRKVKAHTNGKPKRRIEKKKTIGRCQSNEMRNNEEAQEEGGSLAKTCHFGEGLLTFKSIKKCMMGMKNGIH
jgi:hypothetical protein